MSVAQRDGDISDWRPGLRMSGQPGFNCDDSEASQQQHGADGVQGLVEGEGVVDGRGSAQVT